MKIAQVVCTFPPYEGGIGNSAFHFAHFFSKDNLEFTTFTPVYKKTKEFNNKNSKVIRLKPWLKYGNGAFVPQLLWRLKKYNTIYLHYPFFGSAEIIWLYKLLNKKTKLIIHYHMDVDGLNLFSKILSLPSKIILKSLFKLADGVTCASLDYIKNSDISDIYFKNKNKFHEIPFGVDINKFSPSNNKDNKLIKLLFVGGLDQAHYFKGVDILLQAVSRLNNKNWELRIIGKGNLLPKYKKLSKKLKISKQIHFLNNISNQELPGVYSDSNLFILPSINKNEAFGIVLLEAMASGLPVIASNLPGVRTVFEDQKQGLLIEPNNINNLKNNIESLINNKEKLTKMGLEARELVEKKYNWKNIAKKFNKILTNLYIRN